MKVREIIECCTSPVWITLDQDSRNGERELLVENTGNAEYVLSEQVLDHEVYDMHCEDDRLVISLFTLADSWVEMRGEEYGNQR